MRRPESGEGACSLSLASDLAGQARTPRDALAAFVEDELGVRLDDLMGAWASPAVEVLAEHAEALDAAEADAEGLELLRDVLRVAWRMHELDDTNANMEELRARYEVLQRRAHDAVDA